MFPYFSCLQRSGKTGDVSKIDQRTLTKKASARDLKLR